MTIALGLTTANPITEDGVDVITDNLELDRRFFVHETLTRVGNDLFGRLRNGTFQGHDTFARRRLLRQALRRVLAASFVSEYLGKVLIEIEYAGVAAIAAAGGFNPELLSAMYNGKDDPNRVVLALRRLATTFGLLYSPMLDFVPSNVEMWIRGIEANTITKILANGDTKQDLWLLCKWAAWGRNWLWNQITSDRPMVVHVEIHAGNMHPVEMIEHHRQPVAV